MCQSVDDPLRFWDQSVKDQGHSNHQHVNIQTKSCLDKYMQNLPRFVKFGTDMHVWV